MLTHLLLCCLPFLHTRAWKRCWIANDNAHDAGYVNGLRSGFGLCVLRDAWKKIRGCALNGVRVSESIVAHPGWCMASLFYDAIWSLVLRWSMHLYYCQYQHVPGIGCDSEWKQHYHRSRGRSGEPPRGGENTRYDYKLFKTSSIHGIKCMHLWANILNRTNT